MKSRLLSVAVTCLTAVALPLALQAPASAKDDSEKKPKKDATPAETGCYDINGGSARYTRDRDADGGLLNSGDAVLALFLSAPSCSTVVYTMTVHGTGGQVLGTSTFVGDGIKGTSEDPIVLTYDVQDYAESCLMLVGTTSVDGTVVDTAPDAFPSYGEVCDGGSPGLTYK